MCHASIPGMLWVSRDTCSLLGEVPGDCRKIRDGQSEILTLSRGYFPVCLGDFLLQEILVLCSEKSRCKAVISWVGDFFILKSLYSPHFILLKLYTSALFWQVQVISPLCT